MPGSIIESTSVPSGQSSTGAPSVYSPAGQSPLSTKTSDRGHVTPEATMVGTPATIVLIVPAVESETQTSPSASTAIPNGSVKPEAYSWIA